VAARQQGVGRVIMLEKAPESEFGGNARFSHTGFRTVHSGAAEIRGFLTGVSDAEFNRMHIDAYSPDNFMDDLQAVTQGRIDRVLARVLIDESNAAVHWMQDTGIKWTTTLGRRVIGDQIYFDPGFLLAADGYGIGQLQRWREIALGLGVEIRYESKVTQIHGDHQSVSGVRVASPDGQYDLAAAAVLLAAGGFQASSEKRARYLGRNADLMKVRGTKHDTGEVLMAAIDLGAATAGQWQGAHATAIDGSAPEFESGQFANRYAYMWGITVNRLGERFFDEGEAELGYTYAKTGWLTLEQQGGQGFQIFDQKCLPLLLPREAYETATRFEAPTVSELAQKIGIAPILLEETIHSFNGAVQEHVPFDASRRDGRGTVGIQPQKTNWARKLDEPPFLAIPVTAGITFSFGGLRIDENAQVLNTGLQPIRGLYASGDIIGLFYFNYPAASGQTRNAVFSRVAAKHIGQTAGRSAQAIPAPLVAASP
jgi:tricarballylate dehydrogenase